MNRIVFGSTFAAAALLSSLAFAQVRHEGSWPIETKHVSIDATHITRKDAILRVAKEAGWSVVLRDVDERAMDLHLADLPADKALDVILADGEFVAKRDGTLITISSAADAAASQAPIATVAPPPIPTAIVAAPAATTRGEDRIVHGGSLVIAENETVHDVTVFGGSLEIRGTVTGNMTVFGGSCHVRSGAHVVGNATALGGSIDVDDGAAVDGDVGVVGGSLDRHKGAKVGGRVHKSDDVEIGSSSGPRSLLREVSDATTRAAMLFVFGAVLFALAGQRMNALRVEAASRPMRSFALGIVGGLAFLLSVVVVSITIIGIPVAIVLLLGGVFAAYAGICAVLATAGKALIGHKSDNPHVHLLVGCLVFLVSGAIPFINGLVTLAVVLMGIGVVVATRGAGTIGSKGPSSAGPYRTEVTTY